MLTRRIFLHRSALAMVGVGAAPAWLGRAVYADAGRGKKILVAIFQRGAADGLNVVVPFTEKRYYEMRPTIAVPQPSSKQAESALDLDGFFGLHPSLGPLHKLYQQRQLAIVHAAGSPDPTRSHFDAQDFMESGTPGVKSTRGGWLNRALPSERGPRSPLRAVAFGQSLPRTMRGPNPAAAIDEIGNFQIRDQKAAGGFESMYASSVDAVLHGPGRDTFEAVKLLQSIQKQTYTPAGGASYPRGRLGDSLQQIARLIKAEVGVEVAFADIGGWDHHVNEVGLTVSQGPLANLLRDLGQALAAFHQDLGDRMGGIAVVTMSEFGRTARENGNRGTDHGHANAMFVMGGGVGGGKVYGQWPGLETEQLYQARDLAVTTDYRQVLAELVENHLGNRKLEAVFPGFAPDPQKLPGLVAST